MAYRSTHQLEKELALLSEQLEVARELERAAEKRHSDEGMAETALEGRKKEQSASARGAPDSSGSSTSGQ